MATATLDTQMIHELPAYADRFPGPTAFNAVIEPLLLRSYQIHPVTEEVMRSIPPAHFADLSVIRRIWMPNFQEGYNI